jgi:hypothetical protein
MAFGDDHTAPPSRSRNPRISIVGDDLAAVDEVLRNWVHLLVAQFGEDWPAVMSGGVRSITSPWPKCWDDHPGLVARLRALKRHHDALEAGTTKGDPYLASYDWFNFLQDSVAQMAHLISRKICLSAHVPEPGRQRPQPAPPTPAQPPLPSQQQPAPAAPTAPRRPGPWDGLISRTTRPPSGPVQEHDPVGR